MIGLRDDPGSVPSTVGPDPAGVSHAPALAAKAFAEHGWLQEGLRLEHRPQQEQMARAVAAALRDDEVLLFEAGTGVGKSLAYLVPGIIHAMDQSRQMIVSTHTISLQEQIETKDLPLCRRLFESVGELRPYAKFKSAVLVGKANYLCTTRLAHALQGRHELFPTAEQEELQRIAAWAQETREGLRHELQPAPSPEVWEAVNADSSTCSHKHCGGGHCFYQRARARLRHAQLIIVNHSLLFTHINAGGAAEKGGGRGVLFPDDFVVLDEAQTVPEVATEHFGLRLSSYGTDRLLKYLWNPAKKRGLLHRLGGAREKQLVEDALEAAEQFFGFLRDNLLAKQPIVRVREEGFAEPWLDAPLLALVQGRRRARRPPRRGPRPRRTARAARPADHLPHGPPTVSRPERRGPCALGSNAPAARARSSPCAPRRSTWRRTCASISCGGRTSVVFTSATLAMGGQIEPFQQRVGAEDARAVMVASPFDYERHLRVYVAADMPLPSPADARLALDVADRLPRILHACASRAARSCFSPATTTCASAPTRWRPSTRGTAARSYLQGADASRTELARRMRAAGNAILFGTDSFWSGVDVPGEALSQVIITRLPFEVPTHPVAEARAEWIRERGGNPFNELTLPEALVKFRQGVGRLIRTQTDRGLVTILDSRVLAKTYGRLFLECLPKRDFQRITRENRAERFKPFV